MTRTASTFGRRMRVAILGACLAAGVSLFAAVPAEATQFIPHTLAGSFDGSDSTGGGFGSTVAGVAVDQQTGDVYVATTQSGLKVYKFNANGVATAFTDPSLAGSTVLSAGASQVCSCSPPSIAVDNSGGPTQGRIYIANSWDNHVFAFEPSGKPVGGKFPLSVGPNAVAVEPATGDFWLSDVHLIGELTQYTPDGTETGKVVMVPEEGFGPYGLAVDPQGNAYAYSFQSGLMKVDQSGTLLLALPTATRFFAVDALNGDLFYASYQQGTELDANGDELPGFTYSGSPESVAINGQNHYLYLGFPGSIDIFAPAPPVTLADVKLEAPSNIAATSLTLNGSLNPEGVETTSCKFEYGPTVSYGTTLPCEQGEAFSGSSETAVSAAISGLRQGASYHYRLDVGNANGTFKTHDATATPSALPKVEETYVDTVHSDSTVVHTSITPEGAPTTYHIDYGTEDCLVSPGACTSSPETSSVGSGLNPVAQSTKLTGLAAGTTYHYVIVATNQSGTTKSADFTFTTFPYTAVLQDPCPNAHVRQQTGAALLPDCRAYELVSAGNAGGYNVESYLVEGQEPFAGYPQAESPPRALYAVHDGAIPGTGNPTNRGLDPYVATRGEDGWTTKYVGVPANIPYSHESFASPLAGADAALDTFAFGGPGLCSPCFADGTTGVPVTLPNGSLVQGMAGPQEPGPSAQANMLVKKPLSANGTHLIFGSTSEFETGAGSPAIYDRDLTTGVTHAVSKLPAGGSIPCLMDCSSDGLAELDVSADGSRIVIGQLVSTDSTGNHYWHLYMSIGDSGRTVDLTPGAADGALYDGMTADGSMVYFTTADPLGGGDSDTSADLYRADVSGTGATLSRVSTGSGGAGNSDSCDPLGNSADQHWNTVGASANCGVVAVGGGGGVAAGDGTVYFLSPELLDGSAEPEDGVENAPNMYVARPGSAPRFVATLESTLTGPTPPLEYHRYVGSFGTTKNPQFVAVDNSGGASDGDVYVADTSTNVIRKYDSSGNLITSWAENGVLADTAPEEPFHQIAGIAVGPEGDLYVGVLKTVSNSENDFYKFDPSGTSVVGAYSLGYAGLKPVGISVGPEGDIFYVNSYYELASRYKPGSYGGTAISTWLYESGSKSGVAVDPNSGDFYVGFGGSSIARFSFDGSGRVIQANGVPCSSECEPSETFGAGEVAGAEGMAVEPSDGDLYVDEGSKILRFHSNGHLVPGPLTGAEVLSHSTAVAISTAGDLYATSAGSEGAAVDAFGPLVRAPDIRTDNPLVIHSVREAETRHTGDFQVTPNGDDAAFTSTVPFTGYVNAGHSEVFRYDLPGDELACPSCNPTGAVATGNASLASNGLSLTDDGTVFFDSADPLAPRDLDGRQDVYEWKEGKVGLISTGVSPFDSSLLSASANGTDAYFFTRDTLVKQDRNGDLVKIYDARAGGGFPYVPPPVPCKASDECHGAGTQPPPPANVNTVTGTTGNHVPASAPRHCRRGFVKRHGRCVKRHGRHHRSRHRHRRRAGRHHAERRGGKR